MEWQSIIDFIAQNGIWAGLFIWLFLSSRKESLERENRLTGIVEEQEKRLTEISQTLTNINDRLERIEYK